MNYTQSDVQGYTIEDFENCMLEFLKQQEKQEDLKRLNEIIERQERFGKLLECLTKENYPRNLCNIIAKGFWFMPLGLVRLRTFRLSTWVS